MDSYLCRVVAVDPMTGAPCSVAFVEPCRTCGCHHRHDFRDGEHKAHCAMPDAPSYLLTMPKGIELERQVESVTIATRVVRPGRRPRRAAGSWLR